LKVAPPSELTGYSYDGLVPAAVTLKVAGAGATTL
jgi:hypothetical protein